MTIWRNGSAGSPSDFLTGKINGPIQLAVKRPKSAIVSVRRKEEVGRDVLDAGKHVNGYGEEFVGDLNLSCNF